MPSPFPGMNPYLEDPELWSAVHSRLIVAIADDLVDRLSERYRVEIENRVEIEKRTYFSSDDESLLVGIPDVSVATTRATAATAMATITSPVQPEEVVVPVALEVSERYLEIREVATGSVVTVIELLSPKNKRSGEGRGAYERKRDRILASATHLVEIDLLRGGKPLPVSSNRRSDYRMLICRGDRRPLGDLYSFNLRQTIPPIPIPLLPGEAEPILDLQPLLHRVYEKGRYHLAIDYDRPPQPPLSGEDREWANAVLRSFS